MAAFTRRWSLALFISICFLFSLLHTRSVPVPSVPIQPVPIQPVPVQPVPVKPVSVQSPLPTKTFVENEQPPDQWWKSYVPRNPVTSMVPLPSGESAAIPPIQFKFGKEDESAKRVRMQRRDAIKDSLLHSWKGYKEHGWGSDEIGPISGKKKDTFGGWGATLVDSLDTLWIMDLKDEFEEAVAAIEWIDFSFTETLTLNVFETTIRYLGGLMAAYDLSEGDYPVLLQKAVELGDLLYIAFDTENRLPVLQWFWPASKDGGEQMNSKTSVLAELGSLSVEFTRLSQLTNDPRYFDAIQRITDVLHEHQNTTKIPGMWPIIVDTITPNFQNDRRFTFGSMSDSLYEYLPKEYLMLGGLSPQYKDMYTAAVDVAKKHLFFRPFTSDNADILISGQANVDTRSNIDLSPDTEHLACFAGGMMAMGAKIFDRPDELEIGRKLTEGCIWAYRSTPTGIMPESFRAVACAKKDPDCTWTPRIWYNSRRDDQTPLSELEERAKEKKKIPGFLSIIDKRYFLRPEAIESVFILYRITGDASFQDKGWDMFTAIKKYAQTNIAFGTIKDVSSPNSKILDEMESFWTGETLKYFYLLFSEPDLVSLDKYVFNTEAHPLLRPT